MMFEKKNTYPSIPSKGTKKTNIEKTKQNANFRNFKLTKKHFFLQLSYN